ncbi:alkaline phosphatase D family protein [Corynebacterium falsenii]|uniref:alkaline phosphatase D family protein n=1 Tax=Corynebacterium falsenii TaxID=108486 RepID=UPI001CCA3681|nr:alkaline phosphatase D family protein [Corynebacterium falsenii]UBI06945.1 alkaline phosphatase D family protein [Corynebacterium falsenii]
MSDTSPSARSAVPRRRVLQTGAVGAAALGLSAALPQSASANAPAAPAAGAPAPGSAGSAFQHGVASGDPYPTRVILWTRVTSNDADYPGLGKGTPTAVTWEVASDEGFGTIVSSGSVTATPDTDMTVKVEAANLQPYTPYFYRFTVTDGEKKGQVSPVGRTRTAPASGQDMSELRFALFSCSNWEAGYFNAYRDMSQRGDIDYALHVGDYIYEYKRGEYTGKTGAVRDHEPANEIVSLADYRQRYALHHTDPDVQAGHAACPWIVTWDDHEVANDAWSGGAENHSPEEGDFTARRNAAMQAYTEWLPIRATPVSQGGHIYRNLGFGNLLELNMLDLRTYRNEQASFKNSKVVDDDSRTMMGSEQFGWLTKKLASSTARWNVIGNSVMISPVLIPPLDPQTTAAVTQLLGLPEQGMPYNFDQWDGYAAERRKLIRFLQDKNINNTVWLTGDIHTSWAVDVPVEPATYPASGTAAVEIVCPSLTSSNIDDILKLPEDNPLSQGAELAFTNLNKHIQYLDMDSHGYTVVQITPDFVQADWLFQAPDGKLIAGAPLHYAQSARAAHGQGIRPIMGAINPAVHSAR